MHNALQIVEDKIESVLCLQGFSRTNRDHRRFRPSFRDFVGIQLRSDRQAFAINFGVAPLFLIEAGVPLIPRKYGIEACEVAVRVSPAGQSDAWWPVAGDIQVASSCVSLFNEQLDPFFSAFSTVESAIAPLSVASIDLKASLPLHLAGVTRVRLALLAATGNLVLGRKLEARELAEYGLSIIGRAASLKPDFRRVLEQVS